MFYGLVNDIEELGGGGLSRDDVVFPLLISGFKVHENSQTTNRIVSGKLHNIGLFLAFVTFF